MLQETSDALGGAAAEGHELSPQQIAFFETFGFVKLPGLFRAEADRLIAGFEEVFANEASPVMETNEKLHLEQRRVIALSIIDKSDDLRWLRDDPRVLGVVHALMGERYEFAESDGSLFYCESSWHADTYGAPLDQYHLKLSFYLDPLDGDSGAIRMIPGTNHFREVFGRTLRKNLMNPTKIKRIYGVEGNEIPSWPIDSQPGDVIVWNYRTIHASYNGGERRRLFSMSFREPKADQPGE